MPVTPLSDEDVDRIARRVVWKLIVYGLLILAVPWIAQYVAFALVALLSAGTHGNAFVLLLPSRQRCWAFPCLLCSGSGGSLAARGDQPRFGSLSSRRRQRGQASISTFIVPSPSSASSPKISFHAPPLPPVRSAVSPSEWSSAPQRRHASPGVCGSSLIAKVRRAFRRTGERFSRPSPHL